MSVLIRPAREDELDLVGQIVAAAYLADGAIDPADPYLDKIRASRSRAADSTLLVAEVDGEVVGAVTWCPRGSSAREITTDVEGEFRHLGVLPKARGLGVGRALAAHCLELGRQGGYAAVAISSDRWMSAAHHMYEQMGFVRQPERDWTPVPGTHLMVMRHTFTQA